MPRNIHYILVNGVPKVAGLFEWARWFESHSEDRVVERTTLGAAEDETVVSTVFLGLDHNFRGSGPPILFETMAFGRFSNEGRSRYATWGAAKRGHFLAVERVRAALAKLQGSEAGNDQGSESGGASGGEGVA